MAGSSAPPVAAAVGDAVADEGGVTDERRVDRCRLFVRAGRCDGTDVSVRGGPTLEGTGPSVFSGEKASEIWPGPGRARVGCGIAGDRARHSPGCLLPRDRPGGC